MLKVFSIALSFVIMNCSYAAVHSFWETEQINYGVNFNSLANDETFASLRLYEVQNDEPSNPKAIKAIKSIFDTEFIVSGNFKLAVASLVRQEHDLARISLVQITETGIELSNRKTYYENLLQGISSSDKFKYSALINRRGTLNNIPHQFIQQANFDCKIKPKNYVDSIEKPAENFCSAENLEMQSFINSVKVTQVISSGLIIIDNLISGEVIKVEIIIALDTSDISCGKRSYCVSHRHSLANALKSLDYKDNGKMEVGIYMTTQHFEDEYSISYINQNLTELLDE